MRNMRIIGFLTLFLIHLNCLGQSVIEQLFVEMPFEDTFINRLDTGAKTSLLNSNKIHLDLLQNEFITGFKGQRPNIEGNYLTYILKVDSAYEKLDLFAFSTIGDDLRVYSMKYWELSGGNTLIGLIYSPHHENESSEINFYVRFDKEIKKVQNDKYLPDFKTFENLINLNYAREQGINISKDIKLLREIIVDYYSFPLPRQSKSYGFHFKERHAYQASHSGYIDTLKFYRKRYFELKFINDHFELVE